jgi:hypothetical protein
VPTTSSPWASPSSPAGRRLLQAEPATADDIPVLDEATLALGAALVAASTPATPGRSHPRQRPSVARRGLAAAALVVAVLGLGASASRAHPAPTAPTAAAAPTALAHAAGAAVAPAAPEPALTLARRMGTLVALTV